VVADDGNVVDGQELIERLCDSYLRRLLAEDRASRQSGRERGDVEGGLLYIAEDYAEDYADNRVEIVEDAAQQLLSSERVGPFRRTASRTPRRASADSCRGDQGGDCRAGGGQMATIIDGNASDRVFDIEATAGVVEISGVTIQNGNVDSQGGGIRNYADLSLTNSTVSGNTAYTHGGGIYAGPYGDMTITNSTVSDNTASEDGGGINGSNFSMTNSTVNGNIADYRGGGIWGGHFSLANSTVSGNTANLVGGLLASSATITNSTVSENTSSGFGDGIYGVASTLANTIVADNGVRNCGGSGISSLGNNLTDDDTCGFTEPTDLVVADAMLGPLQNNGGPTETHDLLPGSPAIDAGSMDCPPPDTDQRGVARPQGAACDIGAVEYLPEPGSSVMLVGGIGLLGLLYRRRARGLRLG